jgi:hypothetical protein
VVDTCSMHWKEIDGVHAFGQKMWKEETTWETQVRCFQELEYEDMEYSNAAQNAVQCQALVNTAINLRCS